MFKNIFKRKSSKRLYNTPWYKIREMVADDVLICAKLIVDTFHEDGIWLKFETVFEDLSLAIKSPNYGEKYFVAENLDNNKIIGIGGVAMAFMANSTFELAYGTVAKEYQRCGIGLALTVKRIDYIKTQAKRGYVFVSARYPQFFEKLGFVSVVNKTNEGEHSTFCCLKF